MRTLLKFGANFADSIWRLFPGQPMTAGRSLLVQLYSSEPANGFVQRVNAPTAINLFGGATDHQQTQRRGAHKPYVFGFAVRDN
jgi:hypothetical protein